MCKCTRKDKQIGKDTLREVKVQYERLLLYRDMLSANPEYESWQSVRILILPMSFYPLHNSFTFTVRVYNLFLVGHSNGKEPSRCSRDLLRAEGV